jgi:hypothetical protein
MDHTLRREYPTNKESESCQKSWVEPKFSQAEDPELYSLELTAEYTRR